MTDGPLLFCTTCSPNPDEDTDGGFAFGDSNAPEEKCTRCGLGDANPPLTMKLGWSGNGRTRGPGGLAWSGDAKPTEPTK